jgi:hypothetical protein
MLVLTILVSENERILSLKPDVDGRSSSKYAEFTGSGIPIAPANVLASKGTVIAELFGFSGRTKNYCETFNCFAGRGTGAYKSPT